MAEQNSKEEIEESATPENSRNLLNLPDSLLLQVFSSLPLQSVMGVSLTCDRFNRIAHDDQLWKSFVQRDFKISRLQPMHPLACSWRAEYRRMYDESPAELVEEMTMHDDEVWHASFSHDGTMFATCSKDGSVKLWNATTPCTLSFTADMKTRFSWGHTEYSQFNKSDTLLLVSGILDTINMWRGEIAIFDLKQEFTMMSRIPARPFSAFGAWYDENHVLTCSRQKDHFESISTVWLAKATRNVPSDRKYAIMNPFRFKNIDEDCMRMIMVANVPAVASVTSGLKSNLSSPQDNHALGISPLVTLPDIEKKIVQTEKLLIFALSYQPCSPHFVGIKRLTEEEIRKEEESTEGLHWPETEDSLLRADLAVLGIQHFQKLDHTINMHSKIVGMALSPDERYLYVNTQRLLKHSKTEDLMEPISVAHEVETRVIDLVKFEEVGNVIKAHTGGANNGDIGFLVFLDVSQLYVASGSHDNQGYMWDRHYGVCVRSFSHSAAVNSCAFNPRDPEMLVTVSDDNTIRIWRSRRQIRKMREED